MPVSSITEMTQYLSFKLDDETFAMDISTVREVLEFKSVTKVPQTPDFMKGVINLRGQVVPVIDLKLKFGMGDTEKAVNTCVIITEVNLDNETIVLGAMADSVEEVFGIEPENIEPVPGIGTHIKTEFLKGMGKKDSEFMLILDIDKVFTSEEIDHVQEGSGKMEEDFIEHMVDHGLSGPEMDG